MLLSVMGIAPELAGNGHAAMELAASRPFDLAIVDLGLPDVDGGDLVRTLRSTDPAMVIVIMSGDTLRIDAARHLADHCLEKPMSAHALRIAVDSLLLSQRLAVS